MRVHLVHAHPEPNSFVSAMRDVVIDELKAAGAIVTICDLYHNGFNPVLSGNDFTSRSRPDYLVYTLEQRHGYTTSTLASDVAREVENVMSADLIVFTFPVFWFSVPAILKGWIDRILLCGLMHSGNRGFYDLGGLRGKRTFTAMALGGRRNMFGPGALHGELETGMMRHFFQGTLGYVGLTVHKPFVAYHVPYITDHERQTQLQELRVYLRELDRQPILKFPELRDFDDVLTPKRDRAR
ncbi:NAD(P)H-dependent oxidoreductase [Bradyrhizobium sp. WSM 1738]|uniref:NAD(P)H-dependent oxidoreductase n=1 Tax=Bradyrhizobium hereditatis TaxID=2821405 RepID=UPI001CE3854C|nr:NAD(P)H-dependent oxidoreductase [Bradyrhizobium hereditatis]MCA6117410.1 NAD(P)H-dependent oxidoreductase [Bradyrhizobium hereditatis]